MPVIPLDVKGFMKILQIDKIFITEKMIYYYNSFSE